MPGGTRVAGCPNLGGLGCSFDSASACGRPRSRDSRTLSILFRRECGRHIRTGRSGLVYPPCAFARGRPIRNAPLMRLLFPFSVFRSRCAILGSQPQDHPASTFLGALRATAGGRFWLAREKFVLAVFPPCVHRARLTPLRTTVSTGPVGSCIAVSLSRDVPLPEPPNPGATGPDRTCDADTAPRSDNAHRIRTLFAVFPVHGSRRL